MRNSVWKKMALLAFIWVFAAASCLSAYAGDFKLGYNTNASSNDYIFTTKAPKGNIGKSMSIPFRIRATDEDMNNLRVSLLETSDFQQIESSGDGGRFFCINSWCHAGQAPNYRAGCNAPGV